MDWRYFRRYFFRGFFVSLAIGAVFLVYALSLNAASLTPHQYWEFFVGWLAFAIFGGIGAVVPFPFSGGATTLWTSRLFPKYSERGRNIATFCFFAIYVVYIVAGIWIVSNF